TRAIVSVGASNGAVHTEIKLTPEGPRIIEVNGRLGGCIGELLAEAGYNVVAEIGRVALGRSPLEQPACRHYVSFLTPRTLAAYVRVPSVSGLADIAELAGVRVVRSYLVEGTVPEWRRGGGLIASMRLSAPTLDDMLALQHRVLTTLQLEYGPARD